MQRDSQKTRKRILKAVERLLARSGFRGLGINAVAREARVDKVLIYRYFGGLPNLLKAYAEEGDFWPSAEQLLAAADAAGAKTQGELAANLLIEFGRSLRRRPITQEIMRWEIHERNQLTTALGDYREQETAKLLKLFRSKDSVGKNSIDIQAMTSLLGAGLTLLTLRSGTCEIYNGLDLNSDRDWSRIEKGIARLVELAFQDAAQG